jgi:predicted metalloendopeptidase
MNDSEPKYFAEFNALVSDTPVDQIKTYLRWHLLHAYAGSSLPESFDRESWNFYAHTLNGAEKQQELEALHQPRRWRVRRGAGPGVCGALLSAR